MIEDGEELREYLIRKAVHEDIANGIHEAYYRRVFPDGTAAWVYAEIDGVVEFAETLEDEEHDYVDELVSLVRQWQKDED